MPLAADRLVPPTRDAAPKTSPVVALAVIGSLAVHGAAVAAAVGFWGDRETVSPRPIDVVMITVTRPGPAPAPGTPSSAPAPEAAERAGPPAVAMPEAEGAPPAEPAPPPAHQSAPPIAEPAPASAAPIRVAAAEPVPDAARATAPAVRAAERSTAPPSPAAFETAVSPVQVRHVAAAAPMRMAEPPAPVPRPRPAISADRAPRKDTDAQASGAPTTVPSTPSDSSPVQLASRTEAGAPAGGDARPVEFALGSAGNPVPDYPRRARQRGWQGRVVLHVAVDSRGHPTTIRIEQSSGHNVLDEAAYQTVATWMFQPASRGGRPVPGEAIVPVVFRLN